jgi:hypothetical protein
MKDKEKQIEEMANCKNCVHQKICVDKISCGVLTADKDGYLKLKCNYYQPKLPEDSVVLTETESIAMCVEQWNKGYKKGSKETAEKIIKWFKENALDIPSDEYINEFAKQFGVGIKE